MEHEYDISSLSFSPDGKYLFSIDSGLAPSFCLWNWANSSVLQHISLPQNNRTYPIRNSFITFAKEGLIFIIENDISGYRLTLWDFNRKLTFIFLHQLDVEGYCVGLHILSQDGKDISFITVEINSVKYWNLPKNKTTVKLYKNLRIQSTVVKTQFLPFSNILLLLTNDGIALFLNHEVRFVLHNILLVLGKIHQLN
jgi:WD40 repeat protein